MQTLAALAAFGGALSASEVRADSASASPAARIQYEAPAGCPGIEAFRERIRRRTTRFREDAASPNFIGLHASVEVTKQRAAGQLVVTTPTGERASRLLTAATCGEVVDALALMASLSVNLLDSPQSNRPTPPPVPAPAPTPPPPPGPAKVAAPEPRGAFRLGVGTGADAAWGVTPATLVAARFFVDGATGFSNGVGLAVRAAFERAARGDVAGATGSADFTWTVGTLDVCPLQLGAAGFAFLPCARAELGELTGTGLDILPRRQARTVWAAGALAGRMTFAPVRALRVEIEGGARFPFVRDHFVFLPDWPYYEPPAAGGLLGASLVGSFL